MTGRMHLEGKQDVEVVKAANCNTCRKFTALWMPQPSRVHFIVSGYPEDEPWFGKLQLLCAFYGMDFLL